MALSDIVTRVEVLEDSMKQVSEQLFIVKEDLEKTVAEMNARIDKMQETVDFFDSFGQDDEK